MSFSSMKFLADNKDAVKAAGSVGAKVRTTLLAVT